MGCKVLCPSVALLAYLILCQHVRAQCTQPSFASRNVIFTSEHLSSQSFPAGSTVTFECVIGHKPADLRASRSVTCQGNQWTSLELSCTRKSCGSLADFLHGRYEMNGNLFGDTAKPVCDTGYMLAGQETSRTCRDQGWDGRDPLCEPVKCSAPPAIENGQLEDEPLDSYDYLKAVSYRCNGGLNLIGQSTLHCSEDGTFKPDPPKCFDGCPVPMIHNAKRIGGKSPPYKLGNFVKYKCEDGYTMNGEDYIVCRANGWDPEPPRCIEPCGLPELSEHVTLTEEFHSRRTFPHGSNVTVECIHGYEPVDATVSKTITCEQTKWTKSLLTCKALPTTPTTATTTTTPTTAVTSTTATTAVTSTTPTTAVTSRTATTRTAAVTSTTPTTAVTSTTATTPTTAVTSTTPTTAVTSRTATTAVTSTTPTTAVTSTTTTTATTAVTSTVRTTYKAPKEKEDTTNTTTWAKALLGIGGVAVGAGLLYLVFKYFKKQSKHTYSDKVATNNEEDPL